MQFKAVIAYGKRVRNRKIRIYSKIADFQQQVCVLTAVAKLLAFWKVTCGRSCFK
ncbi:hypothetical protein [Nostoc sp.]|uniref:hypothetical protein n=1 Tax=Nostoc sp. TaxID=1180 RepID=UPI002FFA7EEA